MNIVDIYPLARFVSECNLYGLTVTHMYLSMYWLFVCV